MKLTIINSFSNENIIILFFLIVAKNPNYTENVKIPVYSHPPKG